MNITNEKDPQKSPWAGACAEEIDWINRIKIQAAAQQNIDHSISSCITPDSLIETSEGLFYFDELTNFNSIPVDSFVVNKEDIKVLNCDMQFVNLNEFYNNGIKPVLCLGLLNGLEIKCTSNEKFIVLDDKTGLEEWKRLSEIKEGDRIRIKHIDHSK
jgi:hypothetical protein